MDNIWYVKNAPKQVRDVFYRCLTKRAKLRKEVVDSIFVNSDAQTFNINGVVVKTGILLGDGYSPVMVATVLGLNEALYSPELDNVEYVRAARTPMIVLESKIFTRNAFVEKFRMASMTHSFSGRVHSDANRVVKFDIDEALLESSMNTVKLTVGSYGGGVRNLAQSRVLRMNPSGRFVFGENNNLRMFDLFLVSALITNWAEHKIHV